MPHFDSSHSFSRTAASFVIAGGVAAALAVPQLAAACAPLVFPALFLLITFSIAAMADRPLRTLLRPDPLAWQIVAWQLGALPIVLLLATAIPGVPGDLRIYLLLSATAGSLFASPALALMLGLDAPLTTRCMILSTLLMPASLALTVWLAGDLPFHISLEVHADRVLLYLGLPLLLVAAVAPRLRRLQRVPRRVALDTLHWGAVISLLVFGMGLMDGVGEIVVTEPVRLLPYAVAAGLFGILEFTGTIAVFQRFGMKVALTAALLGAFRNLGLSYAVLGTTVDAGVQIYIAVFQLPMLLAPALIRSTHLIAATAKVRRGRIA